MSFSPIPKSAVSPTTPANTDGCPAGIRGRARRTPLGLPVVPEEYSITEPSSSSASGASAGALDSASSNGTKPGISPPTASFFSSLGAREATRAASSAKRACATRSFASQLSTMYWISSSWRCQFTGVK